MTEDTPAGTAPQDAERALPRAATLEALPPPWAEDLTPLIRGLLNSREERLVVLDDDPTGTQTVHGVPVLTTWDVPALAAELADSPVFYVLTNSRSLPTPEAEALAREIGTNLRAAGEQAGRGFSVVSRSDSTLRGHYPAETDALAAALGGGFDGTVLVPFFEEGGRLTFNDIHYVAQGEQLVPAAQTEFAKDASFGFHHSWLPAYVEEKTGGRVQAADVGAITLDDLRRKGPDAVIERLDALQKGGVAVVNSVTYRDQEVFVAGLLSAETMGKRYVYRTAAGFVRIRGGIAARPLLTPQELAGPGGSSGGGLIVVGSYVPKSTEQLGHLQQSADLAQVELQVDALLDADPAKETARAAAAVNQALAAGQDVVLFSSRTLRTGAGQAENLRIGRTISDALCGVVQGLKAAPRFLIAKGGITSSDVATIGLGVRRALVLGQIQPGVPVWRLGQESRFPGMAYVIFPGNVGAADALVQARARFRS